jgi:hypothetical protein
MSKNNSALVGTLVLVLGVSILPGIANAGKPVSASPLPLVAPDTAVSSELLGAGNYSIESDQLGAYLNGGAVTSIIQASSGDWILDVTANSSRAVSVSLNDPVPGSIAQFPATLLKVRSIAKSSDTTAGGFPAVSTFGASVLSPLSFAFTKGGVQYGARMHAVNRPGTDQALLTCTRVDVNSVCDQWTLVPSGVYDGAAKNIAYVEKLVKNKWVAVGYYYLSFNIVVSIP